MAAFPTVVKQVADKISSGEAEELTSPTTTRGTSAGLPASADGLPASSNNQSPNGTTRSNGSTGKKARFHDDESNGRSEAASGPASKAIHANGSSKKSTPQRQLSLPVIPSTFKNDSQHNGHSIGPSLSEENTGEDEDSAELSQRGSTTSRLVPPPSQLPFRTAPRSAMNGNATSTSSKLQRNSGSGMSIWTTSFNRHPHNPATNPPLSVETSQINGTPMIKSDSTAVSPPSGSSRTPSAPLLARSHTTPATITSPVTGTDLNATPTQSKWSTIKSTLVKKNANGKQLVSAAESLDNGLQLTDELLAAGLGVMVLKWELDRDEHGNRRVPVLLHHVRFKIADSIGGLGNHPVFRIECSYGDSGIKWVVYRELRDFLSLHAHYKAANISRIGGKSTSKNGVSIPEFPKKSIPYLRKKGGSKETSETLPSSSATTEKSPSGIERGDYAKSQRDALEKYLLGLIKAVLFRPESNRVIRFLEISSLGISLAQRGGTQGKSGFLRVLNANVSTKKSRTLMTSLAKWGSSVRKQRWWIVRESYLVAVEEPDQMEIFDVFAFDVDFAIQRPKRAYRKGFSAFPGLFHEHESGEEDGDAEENRLTAMEEGIHGVDRASIISAGERDETRSTSKHTFYVQNSQGRLKLVAKQVRQMYQFMISLEHAAKQSLWTGQNRFDSFAPIRLNVAAQWLVDGRDYLWSVSRALLMAKEKVYIHDWWLSPELYLRRPSQEKYRLDNVLKRIADRGVKIYVIVYNEVSNKTTPTDSQHTKKRLMELSENIFVQRSPDHFATGTFYWSHHEKMCVIDETVAFMGGVDLCFGRWDTAQHILVDDDFEPGHFEGETAPIWPGKDYSNPRVLDFHTLNKPMEDLYDREKVPRMPWHDVGMQMVGQPARDLCRHFTQRWNHLLRNKNHTRTMPFLLPPPDFTTKELEELKLTGTCEIQVCRSCGPWSMGTNNRVEHSIQNAYLKAIQMSEHFVYIENQFFITSTVVDGIVLENQIGDALVNRIIKAHEEGTVWRACIVIPLVPGYTYPIDHADASSVRLILECQNKTISRGPNSIFARLRAEGIDPNDYITFFSLRGWGKFKDNVLTTEQVYIHAKCMIVDDRLAIIGSANINERSQRGDRDSELASVIRDTDLIDGKMAGKPFKVGRFAHTLRVRLMREHLGVDVDAIDQEDLMANEPIVAEQDVEVWDPSSEQEGAGEGGVVAKAETTGDRMWLHLSSVVETVTHAEIQQVSKLADKVGDVLHLHPNFEGEEAGPTVARGGAVHELDGKEITDGTSLVTATMEEVVKIENGETVGDGPDSQGTTPAPTTLSTPKDPETHFVQSPVDAPKSFDFGTLNVEAKPDFAEDQHAATRNLGRKSTRKENHPWIAAHPTPSVNPYELDDPLDEKFWKDTWLAVAVHNTEIFRKVFRCVPDDLVVTWGQYNDNINHAEKFNLPPSEKEPQNIGEPHPHVSIHGGPGTHGAGGGGTGGGIVGQGQGDQSRPESAPLQNSRSRSETITSIFNGSTTRAESRGGKKLFSGPNEGFNSWEREKMEELLNEVRGHLVVYPTKFLEEEDRNDNFLFSSDRILPLPIYD